MQNLRCPKPSSLTLASLGLCLSYAPRAAIAYTDPLSLDLPDPPEALDELARQQIAQPEIHPLPTPPQLIASAEIIPSTGNQSLGTGIDRANPNHIHVTGGQSSDGGSNLFHSFEQFNVAPSQTVEFDAGANVRNVVSRVTGGQASQIDGILKVSDQAFGANLYLLNPNGIVFGAGARVNVNGSFTATTASHLKFGQDNFSVQGPVELPQLVGDPTALEFGQNAGAIANFGNLNVPNNLRLAGGTVLNQGSITGRQLNIAAVKGPAQMSLGQGGQVDAIATPLPGGSNNTTPVPSLAALIESRLSSPDQASPNPQVQIIDGQVRISGTGLRVEQGDVVLTTGLSTRSRSSETTDHAIHIQGNNITAQNINARNIDRGSITLTATENLDTQNIIGKDISIKAATVKTGNLSTAIVQTGFTDSDSSPGDVDIRAKYSITTGNIDVSLADLQDSLGGGSAGPAGNITLQGLEGDVVAGSIQTGNLNASQNIISGPASNGGRVTVKALDQITTGNIDTHSINNNGGNVFLDPNGDIQVGWINAGGAIGQTGSGVGGNVTAITGRYFRSTGAFDLGQTQRSIDTSGGAGSGTISITHGGGLDGTPFLIANTNPENGTVGGLFSGNNQLSTPQALSESFVQGRISILTQLPPIEPPIVEPPIIGPPIIEPPIVEPPIIEPSRPAPCPTDSCTLLENLKPNPPIALDADNPWTLLAEQLYTKTYSDYLALPSPEVKSVGKTQMALRRIESQTGAKPALIYLQFSPAGQVQADPASATISGLVTEGLPKPGSDQLDIVMVPLRGAPVRKVVQGARRDRILATAKQFREAVVNPFSPINYQDPGKELYQWLIAPLESELKAQGITNLVFIPDEQMRSLPYAALFDGKDFLIERYSLGLMPSFSLADTTYRPLTESEVLAMGASQFKDLNPLPAAGIEVGLITRSLWKGQSLLNQAFTPSQLTQTRQRNPYGIVHLATHANFETGGLDQSFIAFGDQRLSLDQMRRLELHLPPVELLVLSACQSALGDRTAEMGFAGLATKAGVKSAIASLWSVDDSATLGLMAQLYEQLATASTKSEGLRQAQLAMLRGQVRVEAGQLLTSGRRHPLPEDFAAGADDGDYRHPAYWAGFTTVGSPW